MTELLIISVSGMRGIVGETLTEKVAVEYGCAFGAFLKDSRLASQVTGQENRLSVCIGRDSRPSGPMLVSAVAEGLCSAGIDVVDLGIVTTPGVGIALRDLGCAGGVVITASHNPAPYNGIKLLDSNGTAPPLESAESIKKYFLERNFALVDMSDRGIITRSERTDFTHIARVLAIIDKKTISEKAFKVVLDSVNGAGGRVTKKLLAELGCEVVAMNDEPTGVFPHEPEPTRENLTGLCDVVRAEEADVGFAQDPDADRLAIVDERAEYIGEEYTLALAAKYIFSNGSGNAATNLSTSRMIDDIANRAGGRVIRTAVGEANVAAAMIEHNCIIGGEGNGGVIDLRVGAIRDSLVGIALVLQLMAETDKTISQLAGEIGGYYMSKTKFSADQKQARRILDTAAKALSEARLDTTDGCRFDFDDGWLHLRASNTEPVMRLVVEARGRQPAQKYIDRITNIRARAMAD